MPGPRPGPRAPVFPYTCGPHMRGVGEGAAARRVPGAVKTAPYMALVNGESQGGVLTPPGSRCLPPGPYKLLRM